MVCAGLICAAVRRLQGARWLPCTPKACETSAAALTSWAIWRTPQPSTMTLRAVQMQAAETHDTENFSTCQLLPDVTDCAVEALLHLQRLLPSEPQSSAWQRPRLPLPLALLRRSQLSHPGVQHSIISIPALGMAEHRACTLGSKRDQTCREASSFQPLVLFVAHVQQLY